MIPEIFDIDNNHIVINKDCLLIPELKKISEKYKDPIPAFAYLHYKFSPKGAYCNVPEEDKDEILLMDFPGEYTLEDEEMINAINKMQFLYISPTYRYYLDNKVLMEKLGKFVRENPITVGRDGNMTAMQAQVKNAGRTMADFKELEKIVQQEIDEFKTKIRGGKRISYDQGSQNQ